MYKKDDNYRKHRILNVHQLTVLELCKLGYRLTHDLLPKPLTNALLSDQHNNNLEKLMDTTQDIKPPQICQGHPTAAIEVATCFRLSQSTVNFRTL